MSTKIEAQQGVGSTGGSGWGGNNLGITREHTVWCAGCVEWDQQAEPNKRRFAKDRKAEGWTHKKGVWLCPKCSRPNKADMPPGLK